MIFNLPMFQLILNPSNLTFQAEMVWFLKGRYILPITASSIISIVYLVSKSCIDISKPNFSAFPISLFSTLPHIYTFIAPFIRNIAQTYNT